jgi:hypothetical protein
VPAAWQAILFGPAPDPAAVSALAHDPANESRVRALAFHWLRDRGFEIQRGLVLGIVIEVPLDRGLDVLAAYADGSVRYINHTGRMTFIEAGASSDANGQSQRLIALAGPVIARIGPWDQPRLPPPGQPNLRLTFIVSDGLYVGDGPFRTMEQDALAGPLVSQGTQLLGTVTRLAERAS